MGKKRFDKRSIHRLSVVLSQSNNYYRTLFTTQELKCIDKVKDLKPKDVNKVIVQLYKKKNIRSLFVQNSGVAEMLRN